MENTWNRINEIWLELNRPSPERLNVVLKRRGVNVQLSNLKQFLSRSEKQVFWDTMREMASGFSYSTCHVNKNFNGVPHVDKNNVGLSWALSLGDCEGGELMCETDNPRVLERHTTRRRPVIFDGHRPHWVLPYEGTRYSVILYTSKHGEHLEEDQRDLARAESPEP